MPAIVSYTGRRFERRLACDQSKRVILAPPLPWNPLPLGDALEDAVVDHCPQTGLLYGEQTLERGGLNRRTVHYVCASVVKRKVWFNA